MHQRRTGGPSRQTGRLLLSALVLAFAGSVVLASVAGAKTSTQNAEPIKVGLITKDVTNPFFVKMRQGATAQAKKLGATLVYAAGKNSSDNASQIAAIENMTTSTPAC
jgi:fructose transport system substrate-binding protein